MMRAMVVEDSRLAREGLVRMLATFGTVEVLGAAADPAEALPLIESLRPDLLFLDIHMPGATGFDLLEQLSYVPAVIFTTAYSEHALRSFDFHTIDYLLKPVSPERLALALRKLEASQTSAPDIAPERLDYDSQIFIKDGEHCHLIALSAIQYIESCKNYVQVFFDGKRAYVKKSLNAIEQRLPARYFLRVNRQHIINLQAVISMREAIHQGYDVKLRCGALIEVSRRHAAELKSLLSL